MVFSWFSGADCRAEQSANLFKMKYFQGLLEVTNSSKGDFKIFNFVEDFMITNPTLEK